MRGLRLDVEIFALETAGVFEGEAEAGCSFAAVERGAEFLPVGEVLRELALGDGEVGAPGGGGFFGCVDCALEVEDFGILLARIRDRGEPGVGGGAVAVPPGETGEAEAGVVVGGGEIESAEIGLARLGSLVERGFRGAEFEPGVGVGGIAREDAARDLRGLRETAGAAGFGGARDADVAGDGALRRAGLGAVGKLRGKIGGDQGCRAPDAERMSRASVPSYDKSCLKAARRSVSDLRGGGKELERTAAGVL
jgi:hypothetical protein